MHKQLWIWHRRVGAAVAVMVILLCMTGIALNHTERLGLDRHHVGASWLLDWYGIDAPDQAMSVRAAGREVTLLGDHLYVDQTLVDAPYSSLQGAAAADGMLVVGAGGTVLLLTPELELVERLGPADGLPAGMQALGLAGNGAVVARDDKGTVWQADENLLSWHLAGQPLTLDWPTLERTSGARVSALGQDYRSRVLSAERVLLDLHSGRLFGAWGPLLMDAVALMMLVLSGSGLWLWTRSRH